MKYILTFLIILVGSNIRLSTNKTYSSTGHEQFSEIVLINEEAFIIHNLSESEINASLKTLKGKLFGTREKEFNSFEDCTYVSNTIFSRSNKTREEYAFTYDTSTITYSSVSVSITGSLNVKGVFKGKSKEISAGGTLTGTKETEDYIKNTEAGTLTVVIYPNKKVTLRIVGEAKISNGVQKKFFLGICMKKGAWEVVNVISTCYELLEEDA